MKVFLSWSGPTSKAIAEALRDWLPFVIPDTETWMSDTDIDAGARWSFELAEQLADTAIGIICLTRDNLAAPWLQFEAGALSKTLDNSRVIPYLFNLTPANLAGPLTQFQAVTADKVGTKKLIQTINRSGVRKKKILTDTKLDKTFETWWPQLEQTLKSISPDITNEVAYTFFSKVYGQALENLVVHGTLHEDGSMTVRRESKLTNYSDEIATLEQYLFSDARSGSIDVAQVECLYPTSKSVSWRVQQATSGTLTLLVDIAPPLKKDESIELIVVDRTPPGAITTTYSEMQEMLQHGKAYPYECLFWEIARPTKYLELKVLIPKALAPTSAEPDVWFGAGRITSKQELHRITDAFKRVTAGALYEELSLDIMYPVPGFRYAIRWVPISQEDKT
jgi:TIR domain